MNNYNIETAEYLKHNLQLFQCWLLGKTEEEHVRIYCALTQPRGTVIDMGSGVGTMGELMQDCCPAVKKVINVTNSDVQIAHMNSQNLNCIHADYENVPLEGEIADFVMFNESFGYGSPESLIKESSRLLKKNGCLVIKDFSLGNNLTKPRYLSGWDCHIQPINTIIRLAEENKLKLVAFFHPQVNLERWNNFMEQSSMKDWHGDEASEAQACIYHFIKI